MKGIRFAPSPTGRFHVGNLRTAWISWKWARALGAPWILRFEDIDAERVSPQFRQWQEEDLRALGMEPDAVLVQSEHRARHWDYFLRALQEGWVYPCDCSREEVRRDVAGLASAPHAQGPTYSGACRHKDPRRRFSEKALTIGWRFRVAESGTQDFLVARTAPRLNLEGKPECESFVPSYHWACGLDDFEGAYEGIVRAWDLEQAAPIQHQIGARLYSGRPAPAISHTALVTHDDGRRLEKRSLGVTWPELAAQGWTASSLLERFEASWDKGSLALSGESQRQLRLSSLLGS